MSQGMDERMGVEGVKFRGVRQAKANLAFQAAMNRGGTNLVVSPKVAGSEKMT